MTDDTDDGAAANDGLLSYLPSIVWQRRWWIAVPLILGSVLGIAAAFLLPASYESSALLLVKSQELPNEIVGSSFNSLIDKRIAKIRQQVLSRPDLVDLIQNNNLYGDERQSKPLSTLIERMRNATSIAPVNADIAANGKDSNTIAFSLTFQYPDAQKAQIVAQDFVERLVKLDTTQTAEQAAGAVDFLQDQANGLSGQISKIESQIAGIKSANGATLSNATATMYPGLGGDQYTAQIAGLQRENAQLNAQLNLQSTAIDRDPAVTAAEAQLAGARAVYSDSYPDVKIAEQRLAEARKFAARNVQKQTAAPTIRAQIASNNSAIASLTAARSTEQSRSSAAFSAQAKGPAVIEEIAQLQAKADGLRTNYQAVATNLMNARSAARLSDQQRGERLTVIDPPVVADRPNWPNRPLLIAGGVIGGLMLGVALAFLLELILRPIRGVSALQRIAGAPPLVIIPKLSPPGKRRFPWPFRRAAQADAAV